MRGFRVITLFCTVRIADLQYEDDLGIEENNQLSTEFLSVSLSVSYAPVIVDPSHFVAAQSHY